MANLYINYKEFDPTKMVQSFVVQGTTTFEAKPIQTLELNYEYDTIDGKIVAPLAIEAPEMYSPNGITNINKPFVPDEKNSILFSVFSDRFKQFWSLGINHVGLEQGFWAILYHWCADILWNQRYQIPSIARCNRKEALDGMFPYPIYFEIDNTGRPTLDRNPTKHFDLISKGANKTIFTTSIINESGVSQQQVIDWDKLEGVAMKHIPIITFTRLCVISDRIELHCDITSSVITDILPPIQESAAAQP